MTFTVSITQELIDKTPRGFNYDYLIRYPKHHSLTPENKFEAFVGHCPLEEAISQQTGLGIKISNNGVMTIFGPYWKNIFDFEITFARALDFIKRWRSAKTVKPLDFKFELPKADL